MSPNAQKHYRCAKCGASVDSHSRPWCTTDLTHGPMAVMVVGKPLLSDEVPDHLRGLHGLMRTNHGTLDR